MSKKYMCYLDTETIGMPEDKQFDDNDNLISQLAIILENEKHDLKMFADWSCPKRVDDMTTKAMVLSHLTPDFIKQFEHIKNTKSYQILTKLPENTIYVAHNMTFDKEILRRVKVKLDTYIDTFKILKFMNDNDGMKLENLSLQYAIYYFKLYSHRKSVYEKVSMSTDDCLQAHDARFDTADLYLLTKFLQKKYEMSVEDMIQISMNPIYLTYFPYGSNFGKKFTEMSQGQLEWQLENSNDEDVKYTISKLLS